MRKTSCQISSCQISIYVIQMTGWNYIVLCGLCCAPCADVRSKIQQSIFHSRFSMRIRALVFLVLSAALVSAEDIASSRASAGSARTGSASTGGPAGKGVEVGGKNRPRDPLADVFEYHDGT